MNAPMTSTPLAPPSKKTPSAAQSAAHQALRTSLGRYATRVAVVTVVHQGRPAALTINSFTSVSLEPPLILWCIRHSSSRSPAMTAAHHFAVNFLAENQRELAIRCAVPIAPWPDPECRAGPYGLPILTGTTGHLICRREQVICAGDHLILLGEVLDHQATTRPPLLFLDGGYRTVIVEEPTGEPANHIPDSPGCFGHAEG